MFDRPFFLCHIHLFQYMLSSLILLCFQSTIPSSHQIRPKLKLKNGKAATM
ncbi:hypothetical protein HanXRQr2_Chr07g0291161 [Helianthus annuus]|uniref:Uncharacterized protein n=1 Tax=Helianthus annuus TaxID=4232 RepID=A0A9K3NFJ1_HELAN|nr:hypothetical protein HanXRQr2_Chr07g0291161 [Helianthus annuus]KAJ0556466.1 hypothetical protein HanIR_Chr07g0314211 [Helianthus annuus]KAJ0904414.1 hypothetical protein HanPSC8_Chr07g0281901 [Helianthus annuus]